MNTLGDFKPKILFSHFFLKQNIKKNFSLINRSSILNKFNIHTLIEILKKDGFALGINLPDNFVQQVHQFALKTPCYGNGSTNLGFFYPDKKQAEKKVGQPLAMANYYNTSLFCSAIKQLESDPTLLEIAAEYLEAEPIHQGNQLFWTFPLDSTIYERRRTNQMFYYNSDNCRLLKFSFYITDVDLCSSPDVCVRGSHIKKKLSNLLLPKKGCSYQEIVKYYGYKNIVPICGKAGLGFVKDTLCFHKGTPPSSKERLTLEIVFAAKNYGIQNDIRDASQLKCIL